MLRAGPVSFVVLIGLPHVITALSFVVLGLDCNHFQRIIMKSRQFNKSRHIQLRSDKSQLTDGLYQLNFNDQEKDFYLPRKVYYCVTQRYVQYEMDTSCWTYHTAQGTRAQEVQCFEHNIIHRSVMEFYTTIINAAKLVHHLSRMDSFLVKLLILVLLRFSLKGSFQIELHMLSIALFHVELSTASLPDNTTFSTITTVHQGRTPSKETPVPVIYARGECDRGWIQVQKYCYLPSLEFMTFDHAQRACSYHAANLVSISNEKENRLVFNISRDFLGLSEELSVWIGMERIQKLRWVDKSEVFYENWMMGEPDSNGACVQMTSKGLWEDATCLQKIHFICRKQSYYPPPYTRATELGIIIGIPFGLATIMLTVVGILVCKSIRDADGTYFGYGKNRNKEKMHAAIVNVTASIAHISAQTSYSKSSPHNSSSCSPNRIASPTFSRDNVEAEVSGSSDQTSSHTRPSFQGDPVVVNERSEENEEIQLQICASATSIEQEPARFQSTTSLDYLLSKAFIEPKTRRLRGLRNAEATVRPAGTQGVYRKKDDT